LLCQTNNAQLSTHFSLNQCGGQILRIRRSKADPFGQGRTAFASRETARRIRDWFDWRGTDIPWLFCPIYQGKAINRSISADTVKRLIKASIGKSCHPTGEECREASPLPSSVWGKVQRHDVQHANRTTQSGLIMRRQFSDRLDGGKRPREFS
jgi:hypothetical protein